METVWAQPSSDHKPFFPSKQMRNPKKNYSTRGFISNQSSTENMHKGILLAPPPPPPSISSSCPPSSSLSLHNYQKQQRQQQPPLLPLPTHNSLPSRGQYLSFPAPKNSNRKSNRARDQSLTPKKSKKPTKREDESKLEFFKPAEKAVATKTLSEPFILASVNPSGPDPNDLPKDVSVALSAGIVAVKNFEKFSGSVFTISPPPSSLPLPKFSLRPKLIGCNAEAAGIDTGATDNLRRLLRLR